MGNDLRLSIATHALNITANAEGLVPTLLVFGTVAKIPLGNVFHLVPTQKKRFEAAESARKHFEKIVAKQRLNVASKSRTKGMEIFDVPPGSEVLVYREKKKRWTGPFILRNYDGIKTAFIDMGKFIEPFSIVNVKRFRRENPNTGDRIEVFWPEDKKYYPGRVNSFNEESGEHHVEYDDVDEENIVLTTEVWRPCSK